MRSYVDEFGFYAGQVSDEHAESLDRQTFDIDAPSSTAGDLMGWRISDGGTAWVLTQDMRYSRWFDPNSAAPEFVPSAPDSQPPAGWVRIEQGVQRVLPVVAGVSTTATVTSVTAFQARAAMAQAGLLQAVMDHMASLPATDITRLAWDHALTFKRSSPTIAALAPVLGVSEAQIDALFLAASLIDA